MNQQIPLWTRTLHQSIYTYVELGGDEGQISTSTHFDVGSHLSKHNVPNTLFKYLCDEWITVDKLITFRTSDLDYCNWCDEHSLKTIEEEDL